jgi:molecular chaperone GrpE
MSEPKGPKIDLPEELAEELEESAQEPEATAEAGSPGEDVSDLPAERVVDPEAELEELRDRYLRLAADFENYKRRTLREREELYHYASENLIKELLETVDNLERALEHAHQAAEGGDSKTLLEGVELTHRSLMQALDKVGVSVVSPEGEEFDPNVHEAIRQEPHSDIPSGSVTEVLQKGYVLRERLLRPALVVVSSGS